MRTYTITPVHTEKPVWTEVPWLQVDNVQWLPDAGIRMAQQLCYDGAHLYVHQRAWERNIRAEHSGYLQQVCEDSCMEFFFSIVDERYFNVEINPNGCIRLGFGYANGMRTQLVPKDMETQFSLRANKLQDGWELFYQIPLSLIQQFYPTYCWERGAQLRANCYKCGDLTAQPHYLTWSPVSSDTPSYHRPQDFGLMVFG